MSYLKLTGYINDFSGVIKEDDIINYNKLFSKYDKQEGVQVATVFIKHRNGRKLKDIALEIFNENGIGDKETNSGLLLIVVTEEKKIRIMTGKGMELEFPDSYCRDIIESELRGLMNSGKYDELIESWYELSSKERTTKTGVRGSKKSSQGKTIKKTIKGKDKKGGNILLIIILFFVPGLFMLLALGDLFLLCDFTAVYYIVLISILIYSCYLFFNNSLKWRYLKIISFCFLVLSLFGGFINQFELNYKATDPNGYCEYKKQINYERNLRQKKSSSSSSSSISSSSRSYDDSYDYDTDWGGGSSNGGGWGD